MSKGKELQAMREASPFDLKEELARLHDASFTWAMNCCSFRKEEAQEILQSAYLKVLDGEARFNQRSSFKTWFFSVIRLTAHEQRKNWSIRQNAFQKWLTQGDTWLKQEHKEPAEQLDPKELLSGLSEQQAKVMELVFFHELSVSEAATIMGIGIGSAARHYERAKK